MSNFCPLPFAHTLVSTNGTFKVCCRHRHPEEHNVNINHHDYSVWNQGNYINEVRESFKNNLKHPGCNFCWNAEESGLKSLRQEILQEYKILKTTDCTVTNTPVNIEVQLGNLCNLKCLMCVESASSAILAENKSLGINVYNQEDFQWKETGFENLYNLLNSGPKILNIRGGEPLYNKNLLHLVENLSERAYAHTMLHITSNITTWSDRWAIALQKFKLVRLMLSIDATNDLYEYIRFPAKWAMIESNVKSIKKYNNIKPMIHAVVQNLNVGKIGDLIQWAKQQEIYLQFDLLSIPSHLSITNLPHNLKQQSIDHINQLLNESHSTHINEFLLVCRQQLVNSLEKPFDLEQWHKFQHLIGQRDHIRGNSYTKFL